MTFAAKRVVAASGLAATLSGAVLASAPARADQYHYNNVLIGTRAVGMGGAFGAVADDASGVFYNPAGLAFALSNDISGSANAFYNKSATYKKALCGDDFTEDSAGSVPSFFGGLQKLDRYLEGTVVAFGVYSTDSDLKDQNTSIDNKVCPGGGPTIERYHRTSNARASTYFAGAALGKRVTSNVAFGAGLSYFSADELVQEYQDVKQSVSVPLSDGSTVAGWRILGSNVRERLTVYGVQPVIGVQAALPANFAIGLTYKKGLIASQKLDVNSETRTATITQAQKDQLDDTHSTSAAITENITPEQSKNPVGSWPSELRLGLAWFASPTFMWTLDITYYAAVTNAAKLVSNGNRAKYNREAVTNLATGIEYHLAPAFPLRVGVFTNDDARPQVAKATPDAPSGRTCGAPASYTAAQKAASQDFREKYCGQPDHVDYLGESLFIAWVQPNSQISVGTILQQGKGKAQKLGDQQVQDVVATSYTFAFSATHNL